MNEREKYLFIIKIIVLYNALQLGWSVKMINNKSFELSKKCSKNFELDNFMNTLLGI